MTGLALVLQVLAAIVGRSFVRVAALAHPGSHGHRGQPGVIHDTGGLDPIAAVLLASAWEAFEAVIGA